MSRRTADASKAIRLAWEKEQQRVLEGEGTRDWTKKQQQDIIDRGKAYDEDGKAFEGQHMKSAAEYPEYQGEPDNIQFLTHQEHFEAHRENWQNPTNWYYAPVNKLFHDFGDGKYIPCEVIKLSAPICTDSSAVLNENNSTLEKKTVESEPEIADGIKAETINTENKNLAVKSDSPRADSAPIANQSEPFIIRGFHKVTDGWRNFRTNHPILSSIIVEGTKVAAGAALSCGVSKVVGGSHSGDHSTVSSINRPTANTYGTSKAAETIASAISDSLEHGTHASPIEHTVSGYTRHWNGKEIHVAPYMRGGKK